jgi:hypothetical protein
VLPSPRCIVLLFALALIVCAGAALPEPPKSRAEALAALGGSETAPRLEAIVWLANYGTMTDTDRLHELLRDANDLVRDYAEQALWALWSRSGDAGVDRLMARGVEAMQAGEHQAAIAAFSEVVKRKPAPRSITSPVSMRSRSPIAPRC